MKNTFYSQGNPYNIVRTTSATYTASVGDLIIADETEITLPSGVPAGSVIAVRSSNDTVTTDVVGASGSIDGFSAGATHREAKTGEYVYDGSDWYLRNDVDISNGAIPDSVVSRPTDDSTFSSSDENGLEFEAKADWPSIGVTISANSSGFTRAYLRDDNDNLIQDVDISSLSAGEMFTFDDVNIQNGDIFRITIDAEGSSYTVGFVDESNYPYTSTDLDIIAEHRGRTDQQPRSINDIGNVGFD